MANTIKHKRGTTTPTAGQLVVGEIAINTTTGAAFTKTDGGSVVALNSNNPVFTGNVTAGTNLVSTFSSGDEGGEIQLAKPATNSTLAGTVSIDIYQNKLRFFENGGSTRGAYIDITACTNGVASNLLSGGSTSASWGSITGTLSSQTDLNTALGLKAPLSSPTFTGTPAAPTATTGDSTTALATTAFVQQELASGVAVAKVVMATVRNETGSTITKGSVVYINGAGGNKATIALAQANSEVTSSGTYGLVQADINNNNNGTIVISGIISGLNTNGFTAGTMLYLSPTTAGGLTSTKPSAPDNVVSIGVVAYQHANQGTIQLAIRNGFEVEELHNASISSPADNDLFVYEYSTSLWKNKSFSTLDIATQSWVGSQGFGTVAEAPSDGSEYVRKNGAWSVATGGGGGGASAIPAYDNGVTYTVGQQVIFDNRFWYMSTAVGGAGYDPAGYPSYWTEISSLGGPYLPLAGGTMTGAIVFDATGGQNIDKGTFDSGRYGYNGISLKCAVGYELNWQSGWLTANQFLGTPSIVPLKIDSGAGSPLQVWDGTTGTGTQISHTGISYPDASLQTTAWIDASSDGKAYSRKDGGWVQDRINAYDASLVYQAGDQVVYGNSIYQLTTYIGTAGAAPDVYISDWTSIAGPAGANGTSVVYQGLWNSSTTYSVSEWVSYNDLPYICILANSNNQPDASTTYWLPMYVNGTNGTNGTNGANGSMNYLDIMTITAASYGAYVSSGYWSVSYYFLHYGSMSNGWMENKIGGTVYFNLYVNGVFDSTISGSYDYYTTSGTTTTTSLVTGDHIEVKISDGTNEATINYADFYI